MLCLKNLNISDYDKRILMEILRTREISKTAVKMIISYIITEAQRNYFIILIPFMTNYNFSQSIFCLSLFFKNSKK